MSGFIYIMSNPSHYIMSKPLQVDKLIKIGKSDRDPKLYRKNELQTTGVPAPFHVEYLALVENPDWLEKKVHDELSTFREYANREFFSCSIEKAILTIREFSSDSLKYEEIFYSSPAKIKHAKEREHQKYEESRLKEYKEKAQERTARMQQEEPLKAKKNIEGELDQLYARSVSYIANEPNSKVGVLGDLVNNSVNILTYHHFLIDDRYCPALEQLDAAYKAFKRKKLRRYAVRIHGNTIGRIADGDADFIQSCSNEMKSLSEKIKKNNRIPNRLVRKNW